MTSEHAAESTLWVGRNTSKDLLREQVWASLQAAGAVDGDPRGTIPDFVGADVAAARLAELPIWQDAEVVKCTPDACQQPIRLRALKDGKVLYMAYPRLAAYPCFLRLTATDLESRGIGLDEASTMDGAIVAGIPTPFEDMEHIDLVNVGSVAVTRAGGRTGKGAGFADLELALLREMKVVDDATVVASTVHPLSVIPNEEITMTPTDSPLDWVVTADEVIPTNTPYSGPAGIEWSLVQPDQIDSIPILAMLHARRTAQADD